EPPRQDLHLVGLLALGGEARSARLPRIEEGLDVVLAQLQPRRAAIHHRAQRGAMAFPPARVTQQVPECVDAHGGRYSLISCALSIPHLHPAISPPSSSPRKRGPSWRCAATCRAGFPLSRE